MIRILYYRFSTCVSLCLYPCNYLHIFQLNIVYSLQVTHVQIYMKLYTFYGMYISHTFTYIFMHLGQREIAALRLMYETYSQNPQYGDKKNFQGELEAATLKVDR